MINTFFPNTSRRCTRKSSLLDLFITNDANFVNLVKVDDICYSDHKIVRIYSNFFNTSIKSSVSYPKSMPTQELDFSKFNITNANFDDINSELSAINWDEIVNMPLNDFPSYFSNIVYSVLNKHCQINSNHDSSKKSSSTRKIGAINRKIRRHKAKIKFSDCNSSNKLVLLGKISQLEQSKKEIFLSKSLKEEVRAVNKIK